MVLMPKLLLLLIIALTTGAFAQCPVEIVKQELVIDEYRLWYVNVSGKVITNIKFGYLRPTPFDEVLFGSSLLDRDRMKPGKKAKGVWHRPYADRDGGFLPWVWKVRFADGTVWADDGTYRCHEQWNDLPPDFLHQHKDMIDAMDQLNL